MATETLPPFFNMECTDKGDRFSADFYLYNDQTFQTLNARITKYGINFPSFTSAEVAAFPSSVPKGTTWYNSDLEELQFSRGGGTIRTIQSA